jgi:hypothetical protein
MGALAGRSGRHRSGLAGAAGLILALVALAVPAAAQAGPTLVSWERAGGLLGFQDGARILKDRTIFAAGGEGSTQARITRAEKAKLKARLEGWRRWKARYEPEVLVLDEPTVGLDPVLRRDLWDFFNELADSGSTLLVSSHVMDEADRCEQLVLIREGHLLAVESPERLREQTGKDDLDAAFLQLIEGGS